jgi:N-acetylglucosamine-6-sulfatase
MRNALTTACAAAIAASACAGADDPGTDVVELPVAGDAPPLNVVVIMTDDLDEDSMRVLLDHDLVPNIEHDIYGRGVVFRRSFVSNSVCCPSRATFLTGQYSHSNGVLTSKGRDPNGGVDALDDSSTLATWLQDAGYRTGHIGKYLNGYGIDRFSEIPQFHPSYVPPGWDHWQALIGATTYNTFDYRINDTVDGTTRIVRYGTSPEEYQTTVLASRADAFIRDAERRDDEQPFFLVVTPLAPHGEGKRDPDRRWSWYLNPDPLDAVAKKDQMALISTLTPLGYDKPSFDYTDPLAPTWLRNAGDQPLTDIERADITAYYRDRLGAMLAVDDLVGTVMTALRDTGELDHTVVIFTSDNGFLFGEHRLHSKKVAFDEATRVPLVIRMPDERHARADQLVVNADLAPTIAELAGVAPGLTVDGRSLVPILTGGTFTSWRKRILLEHWGEFPTIPTYAGLRTPQFLYVQYENDARDRELYDLVHDPYQTDNVSGAAEYQDIAGVLARKLDRMRGCSGDSCRLEENR